MVSVYHVRNFDTPAIVPAPLMFILKVERDTTVGRATRCLAKRFGSEVFRLCTSSRVLDFSETLPNETLFLVPTCFISHTGQRDERLSMTRAVQALIDCGSLAADTRRYASLKRAAAEHGLELSPGSIIRAVPAATGKLAGLQMKFPAGVPATCIKTMHYSLSKMPSTSTAAPDTATVQFTFTVSFNHFLNGGRATTGTLV